MPAYIQLPAAKVQDGKAFLKPVPEQKTEHIDSGDAFKELTSFQEILDTKSMENGRDATLIARIPGIGNSTVAGIYAEFLHEIESIQISQKRSVRGAQGSAGPT
ncbi:hypothetical protein TSTA_057900 [Talaromyces stipitatus ATCC 10500]|uniref:Uncharacterized protein n=1 Tax=Talaromyces stipitatus (strain ATCC 10500 / CBS 375.48 / QM 6759 / NRRL 1006) TaxID=441959 RepID=B8MRW7_TALSN|nr:uncharacterized protein TSTA_057900 [Talaromyces stipitatus ATCC 10500]EED13301.1 hypothetical protein TSTA_057900 [Talaromyces stipitatus ATCC 10500]